MFEEERLIYEFGPFLLDATQRLLSLDGKLVSLEPKVIKTLVVLVEARGNLVETEELIRQVWGDTAVTNDSLHRNIRILRRTLRSAFDGQECIVNIPARGYRFALPINERREDLEVSCPPAVPEPHKEKGRHANLDVSARDTNNGIDFLAQNAISGTAEQPVPTSHGSPVVVEASEPNRGTALRTPISRAGAWRKGGYILVAVLLLAVTTAFVLRFAPASQLKVAQTLALTNDGRGKGGGALLTDGARVYFLQGGPSGATLGAVAVAGGGVAALSLPWRDANVYDLSPHRSELLAGRPISEQEGSELWVAPLLGGSPRRIGDLRVSSANWSPDGRQLAFTLHERLYVANADGSEARKLADIEGQVLWPHWSPDGKTIRFTQQTYQNGEVRDSIWEVGADGSNLRRLLDGWNNPPHECCGTWTPDGKFFIFESMREGRTDLWAVAERRGILGRDSGPPVRLSSGPQDYSFPIASTDGKQIFALVTQQRGELVRFDFRLREFVRFLDGISATWVCFANSGRSVAYIDYPDQTLWRANIDGSEKTQITFSPSEVDGFSWSPDDNWLAFRARTPGKPYMIYMVSSSQGDEPKLLKPGETEQGIPTWSADGRRIAFGDVPKVFNQASGTEAIHILELSTGTLSELPGSRGLWSARWSPDGRTLAALTIVGQRLMLYDFKTRKWRPTKAEQVNNANWSRDSKYIYYDTEGDDRALRRVRVADGEVYQLTSLRRYPRAAQYWSGLTPDNSPMILRDLGTTEIYSLILEGR
jgi:Tol biopolymer transport system component/DNA-binding winged helix-turn-helix (wHTH) protein